MCKLLIGGCFQCGSTDHLKAQCPSDSGYNRSQQGSDIGRLVELSSTRDRGRGRGGPIQHRGQSSVGQAQTQCTSPPSSTGQRNQYRSQGATQAPPLTQADQRDQGMGRGQGQGSQAETSDHMGQTVCYYCRHPRHMRRDCPEK